MKRLLPFVHNGKAAYGFHMKKTKNLEVITVQRYLAADIFHALTTGQPDIIYLKQGAVGGLEKISQALFFSRSFQKTLTTG